MSLAVHAAGEERLADLRDLFLALHDEHRATSALPLTEPDERAWRARRATYTEAFAAGRARLVVAEDAGRLVGYALALVHEGHDDTFALGPRYGELYTLVVAPDARGRGIGTALWRAVESALADEGIASLVVAVMAGNEPARRFYRRHGLVEGEVLYYRVAGPAG